MKSKITIIFLLILLTACTPQYTHPETGEVIELEKVEIVDYEGKKLSSVEDIKDVSIKGPQYIDIETYTLEVSGLVNNPKTYTYEQILDHQKYSKVIDINCVLGWDSTTLWEGILIKDLFEEVEVQPQANTVIFYAADDYTTSHSLKYLTENDILLAYKVNNITLTPEIGYPFMLIAENKWGYKWIKWITKIELSDDEDYLGYWESRGYSKEGHLDDSFYS